MSAKKVLRRTSIKKQVGRPMLSNLLFHCCPAKVISVFLLCTRRPQQEKEDNKDNKHNRHPPTPIIKTTQLEQFPSPPPPWRRKILRLYAAVEKGRKACQDDRQAVKRGAAEWNPCFGHTQIMNSEGVTAPLCRPLWGSSFDVL